ncbi:MAG: ABC transporter ATP-binding protein [Candidatus Omnitrophica bacterium]|nr:ABC transporter ATP-binding protein [Candidatus Omnitrophota bacterium]MDD5553828.1 ABC transporter ATP-binding protein [Candidatus Omnitrophota bacterium]
MLEAKDIRKIYYNGAKQLEVLKGVNLSIDDGKFAAIVGPSGAGKSTLLHILGGLDIPTQGEVIFEGKDIYRLSDAQLSGIRNRRIGFVFQFYHLLGEFNVLENVAMPALINTRSPGRQEAPKAREQALRLLRDMGLGERVKHFPSELSGGEQQRVAIARALMNDPALLLCDEPTGNLDSETSAEIMGLVKKISQENRMSVVLVTHNAELAKTAQIVYNLKDGILI